MYAAVLHKYTALAVEKIRKLVEQGLDAKELMGLNDDGFFGFGKRLKADLINRREAMMHFGRMQVEEELRRQKNEERERS